MNFTDQPANVEWYTMASALKGQKMNPTQHRKAFSTLAEAARFWETLPPGAGQIVLESGHLLHAPDIEAILGGRG